MRAALRLCWWPLTAGTAAWTTSSWSAASASPWLTRFKASRQVSLRHGEPVPVGSLDIPNIGLQVHLRGYGMVLLVRTVDQDGNAEIWATSRLDMSPIARNAYAQRAWLIETYHRVLKQFTGIERGQFRREVSQRNHIGLAIRAYLPLELHRWLYRLPIFAAKLDIIRDAVRLYRAQLRFLLQSTA